MADLAKYRCFQMILRSSVSQNLLPPVENVKFSKIRSFSTWNRSPAASHRAIASPNKPARSPSTLTTCSVASHRKRHAFMQLNADTPLVQPGQMLIVADPRNHHQSTQIAALMQAKSRTSKAVKAGDSDFSAFLHRNYAAIAAFTSYGKRSSGWLRMPENATSARSKYPGRD